MRQFLTLRYWATLLALVGLLLVAMWVSSGDDGSEAVVDDPSSLLVASLDVELLVPVESVHAPDGRQVLQGVLTADIGLVIDATRTMVVKTGTPGEVTCVDLVTPGQCVVAADLQGDAVLRFALVPATGGTTLKLPALMKMLDNRKVLLANGWVVPRALRVERQCDDETTSLQNFIDTFGDSATSTFNFETQELERVTCPRATATTTTTTVTGTGGTVVVGGTDVTGTTAEPG